jgi:hypothetical protein
MVSSTIQALHLIILSPFRDSFSRSRKIRCDSTRPVCNNCTRRCSTCEYDAAPKRRGPDKRPGTRQRTCKKKSSEDLQPMSKRKRASDTSPLNSPTSPTSSHPVNAKIESPINSHHSHSTPGILSPQPPTASDTSSLPLYPPPSQTPSSIHAANNNEVSLEGVES